MGITPITNRTYITYTEYTLPTIKDLYTKCIIQEQVINSILSTQLKDAIQNDQEV